jgi:hypothetical protein
MPNSSPSAEMRLAYFCFIAGAASGLAGMGLGIVMGISQDFSLAPVHAHINLLGWVSMMLYGLYYRGSPHARRLGWFQSGLAATGMAAMTLGLAAMLTGFVDRGPGESATVAGSLMVITALVLFLGILIADLRSTAKVQP